MSMQRKSKGSQENLWVPHDAVARSPGHPFYERLERILSEAGFEDVRVDTNDYAVRFRAVRRS